MATIKLQAPVEWFGQTVSEVTLREPKASHLFRHGEPRFPVHQGDGAFYWCVRDDAVSRYIEDLLSIDGKGSVDGGTGAFIAKLALADGIALSDALFGFFTVARLTQSGTKPTSSSST